MKSMRDIFPDLPAQPRRKRALTAHEQQLWGEESAGIKPLPQHLHHASPKALPIKVALRESVLSASSHHAPLAPLEPRLRQKLLRGRIEVDSKLDLHGFFQDEAHQRLIAFLIEAQRRQYRLVLVVTGKGGVIKSDHPFDLAHGDHRTGVLRRLVPQWLRARELRSVVIGFEEAGPTHGGSGALYVRIRRLDRAS